MFLNSNQELNNCWQLQEAKAHFSEVVRRAQNSGPQHVTVHGREVAVILSESDYARLKGERSGKLLVDLLATTYLEDVEFEHASVRGAVRNVEL